MAGAANDSSMGISQTGLLISKLLTLHPSVDALGVAAVSFVAYVLTMSPTITWQHDATDSAELAAAAYTFGVPHPTGYPLWLLLATIIAHVPVGGDVAGRLGLLSAACASAAAACVTVLTRRMLVTLPAAVGLVRPAALIAGIALAASPAVWNVAVVTETYALHLLLVTLLLALTLVEAPAAAVFFVAGLALANHSTALFAVAVAGIVLAWRKALRWWSLLFMLPGLSLYLVLLWRAAQHPASNWGDPETLGALFTHVSGSTYHYLLASPLSAEGAVRVVATLKSLVGGFPLILWPVAAFGLPFFWQRFNLRIWLLGMLPYVCFPVLYRASGAEHYLLPVYGVLALCCGFGGVAIVKAFGETSMRPGLQFVAVVVLGLAAGIPTAIGSSLRGNYQALDWATATLQAAPPNAVIHTQLDQQTFPLWYAQRVLDKRADVTVVDDRLTAQ